MYAPCEIAALPSDEPEAPFALIPLRNHAGKFVAWTFVDTDDYERLNEHRWYLDSEGYVRRNVPHPDGSSRRTVEKMHRVVLGLSFGDGLQGDHRDLNPLNNRRSNLRVVTNAQNTQNRRPSGHRDSRSRYRGVSFRDGKWQARVVLDGHEYWLGAYLNEGAAGEAAAKFRRERMPYSTN